MVLFLINNLGDVKNFESNINLPSSNAYHWIYYLFCLIFRDFCENEIAQNNDVNQINVQFINSENKNIDRDIITIFDFLSNKIINYDYLKGIADLIKVLNKTLDIFKIEKIILSQKLIEAIDTHITENSNLNYNKFIPIPFIPEEAVAHFKSDSISSNNFINLPASVYTNNLINKENNFNQSNGSSKNDKWRIYDDLNFLGNNKNFDQSNQVKHAPFKDNYLDFFQIFENQGLLVPAQKNLELNEIINKANNDIFFDKRLSINNNTNDEFTFEGNVYESSKYNNANSLMDFQRNFLNGRYNDRKSNSSKSQNNKVNQFNQCGEDYKKINYLHSRNNFATNIKNNTLNFTANEKTNFGNLSPQMLDEVVNMIQRNDPNLTMDRILDIIEQLNNDIFPSICSQGEYILNNNTSHQACNVGGKNPKNNSLSYKRCVSEHTPGINNGSDKYDFNAACLNSPFSYKKALISEIQKLKSKIPVNTIKSNDNDDIVKGIPDTKTSFNSESSHNNKNGTKNFPNNNFNQNYSLNINNYLGFPNLQPSININGNYLNININHNPKENMENEELRKDAKRSNTERESYLLKIPQADKLFLSINDNMNEFQEHNPFMFKNKIINNSTYCRNAYNDQHFMNLNFFSPFQNLQKIFQNVNVNESENISNINEKYALLGQKRKESIYTSDNSDNIFINFNDKQNFKNRKLENNETYNNLCEDRKINISNNAYHCNENNHFSSPDYFSKPAVTLIAEKKNSENFFDNKIKNTIEKQTRLFSNPKNKGSINTINEINLFNNYNINPQDNISNTRNFINQEDNDNLRSEKNFINIKNKNVNSDHYNNFNHENEKTYYSLKNKLCNTEKEFFQLEKKYNKICGFEIKNDNDTNKILNDIKSKDVSENFILNRKSPVTPTHNNSLLNLIDFFNDKVLLNKPQEYDSFYNFNERRESNNKKKEISLGINLPKEMKIYNFCINNTNNISDSEESFSEKDEKNNINKNNKKGIMTEFDNVSYLFSDFIKKPSNNSNTESHFANNLSITDNRPRLSFKTMNQKNLNSCHTFKENIFDDYKYIYDTDSFKNSDDKAHNWKKIHKSILEENLRKENNKKKFLSSSSSNLPIVNKYALKETSNWYNNNNAIFNISKKICIKNVRSRLGVEEVSNKRRKLSIDKIRRRQQHFKKFTSIKTKFSGSTQEYLKHALVEANDKVIVINKNILNIFDKHFSCNKDNYHPFFKLNEGILSLFNKTNEINYFYKNERENYQTHEYKKIHINNPLTNNHDNKNNQLTLTNGKNLRRVNNRKKSKLINKYTLNNKGNHNKYLQNPKSNLSLFQHNCLYSSNINNHNNKKRKCRTANNRNEYPNKILCPRNYGGKRICKNGSKISENFIKKYDDKVNQIIETYRRKRKKIEPANKNFYSNENSNNGNNSFNQSRDGKNQKGEKYEFYEREYIEDKIKTMKMEIEKYSDEYKVDLEETLKDSSHNFMNKHFPIMYDIENFYLFIKKNIKKDIPKLRENLPKPIIDPVINYKSKMHNYINQIQQNLEDDKNTKHKQKFKIFSSLTAIRKIKSDEDIKFSDKNLEQNNAKEDLSGKKFENECKEESIQTINESNKFTFVILEKLQILDDNRENSSIKSIDKNSRENKKEFNIKQNDEIQIVQNLNAGEDDRNFSCETYSEKEETNILQSENRYHNEYIENPISKQDHKKKYFKNVDSKIVNDKNLLTDCEQSKILNVINPKGEYIFENPLKINRVWSPNYLIQTRGKCFLDFIHILFKINDFY